MKQNLMKHILSVFLAASMLLSCFAAGTFAEEIPLEDLYVSLLPTDDATIRANMVDTNFGTKTNLEMDVREGSRRYGLIRYDATGLKAEIDTASRIVFKFYGTNEERCRRLLLYPLYGNHKNFNENTITWSVARGIREGGQSLAEYLGDTIENPTPEENAKWHEIDVTDYVKSQTDYIYAFKTFATTGSTYNCILRSKEAQGFEPQLLIYTDVDAVIKTAASQITRSANLSALTENITLPKEWSCGMGESELCRVSWESSNDDVISFSEEADGFRAVVCQRPSASDGVSHEATVTMTISYKGKQVKQEITARVLAENIVSASADTYAAGGTYSEINYSGENVLKSGSAGIAELDSRIYVSFPKISDEQKSGAERVILRLYNNNEKFVQSAQITVKKLGASTDVNSLTGSTSPDCTGEEVQAFSDYRYHTDIDITDIFDSDSENAFEIFADCEEMSFYSMETELSPQLILMNGGAAQMHESFEKAVLQTENRAAVENDVYLPGCDGFTAEWSTDSEYAEIDGQTLVPDRPPFEEGDKLALVSCKITDGENTLYETLPFNIKCAEPDGINGKRLLKDPMKVSDESFFGKWNEKLNAWETAPVLRYDTFPELKEVSRYVKKGNYYAAKEALLNYYRTRDDKLNYEVTPSISESLSVQLAKEHILSYGQTAFATAKIGEELGWYEIELPASESLKSKYVLTARTKDGSTAVFCSDESDYAPYIEAVTNEGTFILPCNGSTYLKAGANADKNYGTEGILLVHEEGNPLSDDTSRAFISFDKTPITGKEVADDEDDNIELKSAKLMLYGRKINGSGDDMQMLIGGIQNINWKGANDTVWSDHTPGIFNYSDVIYDWSAPYGSESEWIYSVTRQTVVTNLVAAYLGTGNSDYAFSALEDLTGIMTYQKPDFPRALDVGWRTPNLLAAVFGLIDCEYMTPELFCGFIKYAYQEIEFLKDATASVVNQINAVDTGFSRLVIYFPEVCADGYFDKAIARHAATYGSKVEFPDGSYKEATSAYMHRVIDEMCEIIEVLEKTTDIDTTEFRKQAAKLAHFFADSFMPNGYLIPYGDSGRSNINSTNMLKNADFLEDDFLKYVGSGFTEGSDPGYTSKLYPSKNIAIMRTAWDKNAMYSFMNSEYGSSHGHPDNLHIDIYAFGRSLLIDAGNGGGYNPIAPAGYVRNETFPHNTVEVGDEPQSYKIGTTGMSMLTNNVFDKVSAYTDANDGYRHFRNVFLKRGDFWIVSDVIVPNENPETENVFRQNWHPDNFSDLEITDDGRAVTHFKGTANIQIIQDDMGGTQAKQGSSHIRTEKLTNSLEPYVYYEKYTSGTVVYNTLLFPTETGEDVTAEFAAIPCKDNCARETASAMEISYRGKKGWFYTSNEDSPSKRAFGDFETNGRNMYVEDNPDSTLKSISLVQGSKIERNGEILLQCSENVDDLGVTFVGNRVDFSSSNQLSSDIKLKADGVQKVTFNGAEMDFDSEDGYISLTSKQIKLPVVTNGAKVQATLTSDITRRFALTYGKETKYVTATIPAGTTITAPLGWDGTLSFNVSEGDALKITLNGGDCDVVFDTPAVIEVPFYSTNKAYYIRSGEKCSFSSSVDNKNAAIESVDKDVKITTTVGGDFVLVTKSGAITATTPGKASGGGGGGGGGTVTPPKPDNPAVSFTDIDGHWAKETIENMAKRGIVNGYEDSTFRPNGVLTRAEFALMLVRAFNKKAEFSPIFTDVSQSDWFAEGVCAAAEAGFVNGVGNNLFNPGGVVTREEAAKMCVSVLESSGKETPQADLSAFADAESISPWAQSFMQKAVGCGLLKGTDSNHLSPGVGVTRAMAASIIERMLEDK